MVTIGPAEWSIGDRGQYSTLELTKLEGDALTGCPSFIMVTTVVDTSTTEANFHHLNQRGGGVTESCKEFGEIKYVDEHLFIFSAAGSVVKLWPPEAVVLSENPRCQDFNILLRHYVKNLAVHRYSGDSVVVMIMMSCLLR